MPGLIQSIERAAAALRLLAAPPGELSLGELGSALHLAKGTTHGIVRTLVEVGFVVQDPTTGRYRLVDPALGLGVAGGAAGSAYLDPHEVRARSMNWADPLAARTGHSVLVAVLARGANGGRASGSRDAEVVHHVFRPDGSPQRTEVGTLLPAHATALGKVLLAYSPSLAPSAPRRLTHRTITDPAALAAELRQVRTAGVATDCDEYRHGWAGLAAPVRDTGGLVVAAVGVVGHPDALGVGRAAPAPELVERVTECARHIAIELAASRAEVLRRRAGASPR
ncbi:IclR family transcriptional regulator [Jatrophihabitans fulvus]